MRVVSCTLNIKANVYIIEILRAYGSYLMSHEDEGMKHEQTLPLHRTQFSESRKILRYETSGLEFKAPKLGVLNAPRSTSIAR